MKALGIFISVMVALAAAAATILVVVKLLEKRRSILRHYDMYGDDVYDHEEGNWDEVHEDVCCTPDPVVSEEPKEEE